jgi:hypothetical protein
MSSTLIPTDLDKWDIPTLDGLIKLRDIERETFEFKGTDFSKLDQHLCAFANYPESGIIVLGIEEIKPKGVLLKFKKVGFGSNQEDWIRNEVNNQMAKVDPVPRVTVRTVPDKNDAGRLYPVLKIEGKELQRPYFLKNGGVCFVRIGASSSPASRTVVLHLFNDVIGKRNNVSRLRSAASFLREALMYACKSIRDVNPADPDPIIGVDLTYLKNAALSSEWFLANNDLLGGHHNIDSLTGGFYSFIHDIERLNLLIRTYNLSRGVDGRITMKKRMQYWEPEHNDYEQTLGFLNKIIIKCDEFLSQG